MASLEFLRDLPLYEEEQPYTIFESDQISPEEQTNCQFEYRHGVDIFDTRDGANAMSLHVNGFQYLFAPSRNLPTAADIEGPQVGELVMQSYLDETAGIVKEHLGASQVLIIDWRFRRAPQTAMRAGHADRNKRTIALPAAMNPHCDYSFDGGRDRLEMHLLQEELRLIKNHEVRAIIVNAWRPLSTVKQLPLLFCDPRTVLKSDLLECDRVMLDKVEKGYFLLHRSHHRWYWRSAQTPDELAVFKTWEPEQESEKITYPPHSSALINTKNPDSEPGKLRESIEVRMVVLLPGLDRRISPFDYPADGVFMQGSDSRRWEVA